MSNALDMLRFYVPNFFKNFVDNGLVDILRVEVLEGGFLVLSYDDQFHNCFQVGFIEMHEDEDDCFVDQHVTYDSYKEAKEEFLKLYKIAK